MTPLAVSDLFNVSEIVAICAFVLGLIVVITAVQVGASHKKGRMQDLANSGVFTVVAIAFFAFGTSAMVAPEIFTSLGNKILSTLLNLTA